MYTRGPVFRVGVIFLTVTVFMIGVAACGQIGATVPDEPAVEVVHRYFTALQEGDIEKANQCLNNGEQNLYAIYGDDSTSMGSYLTHLMSYLQYDVDEVSLATTTDEGANEKPKRMMEGDTETIKVHVTAMDVPALFEEAMDRFTEEYTASVMDATPIPDEELEPQLFELMKNEMEHSHAPYLSGTLAIQVTWDGEMWSISADRSLYNAVTGNFLQILRSEVE